MNKTINCIATLIIALLGITLPNPLPAKAAATATISITPSSGSQTVGQEFTTTFVLNTGGQSATVVGVEVSYSTNLEFVSFSTTGSVFDTRFKDPSPAANPFRFERANTSGFNGSNGQLIKVTFKPKSAGTGTITINKANSQVYTSGTNPENILQTVNNGSYTLSNPVVPTPTPAPTASVTTQPTTQPTAAPTASTPNAVPSAEKSTVENVPACTPANGTSGAAVKVTVRDANNAVLSGSTYQPKLTISPTQGITTIVKSQGASWLVEVFSKKENKVTLTIVSKGVTLATKEVNFTAACVATPTPTPKPTAIATIAPSDEPDFEVVIASAERERNLWLFILLLIIWGTIVFGSYYFWQRKYKRQHNNA
jgi:hypothetical protein